MGIKIEKIDSISVPDNATVTLKLCGNVAEVKYSQYGNFKQRIRKIDKDKYLVLHTGEVKSFKREENRFCDKRSLKESLMRLKDYINSNVTDVSKCRWVTLTYRELMNDPKRLYQNFKSFNRKCRQRFGNYKYIVACEYQQRGALHLHCVFIFNAKAPFMNNTEIATLWGQGFVNVRELTNINDVGRYLTAYIGDAALDELGVLPKNIKAEDLKTIEVKENGKKVKKAVIKGARLALMPPGFNLYRISRGIKPPVISRITSEEADSVLENWKMTYQATYKLTDENRGFSGVVSTSFYNKI